MPIPKGLSGALSGLEQQSALEGGESMGVVVRAELFLKVLSDCAPRQMAPAESSPELPRVPTGFRMNAGKPRVTPTFGKLA